MLFDRKLIVFGTLKKSILVGSFIKWTGNLYKNDKKCYKWESHTVRDLKCTH